MNPKVIDISHWQPDPSFEQVAAGGTLAVIFKATESDDYVDPTLKERAAAAQEAGLFTSTYHFLRPGDMRKQMEHYLKTVDPVEGERVCLDHEDPKVSLDDLKECVEILLEDERNLQVTIYSGHVIKDQLKNKADLFLSENTSLWIAHYTTQPQPTWPKATWAHWSVWQYTDRAAVQGISGNVDGDKFNGNDEQLMKFFAPVGWIPEEPDEDDEVVVTVDLTLGVTVEAPEGVTVRVTVNGREL